MIKLSSHMNSLLAVLRTQETAEHIKSYCDATPDVCAQISIVESAIADAPAIINGGADIVVIEAGRASNEDIEALKNLCAHVTRGGSFIVILEEPCADFVRRLFQAGVTDVLPTPVMPVELIAALDAARGRQSEHQQKSATKSNGKIVTVLKTAGGVGATTVATNLAGALKQFEFGDVALVDLDIQFGQVATALDLRPRMTVLDAVRADKRLDATLLASTMSPHSSGVKVLCAPNEITPLEAVNGTFIERLISNLRATSAISVIEVPAAWSQWMGELIDATDLVIPVAEATVRSAAGAARIKQSFTDFGLSKVNTYVLINKYEKTLENNDRAKKIADIFGVKPGGAVRLDAKAAAEAADRGLLFSEAALKSLATKDIETTARNIAADLGLELQSDATSTPFGGIIAKPSWLKGRMS